MTSGISSSIKFSPKSAYDGCADAYAMDKLASLRIDWEVRAYLPVAAFLSPLGLMESLVQLVDSGFIKMSSFDDGTILLFDKLIIKTNALTKPFEKMPLRMPIYLYGEPHAVKQAIAAISEKHPSLNSDSVLWYYASNTSVLSRMIDLPSKNPPHDSFFPWIKPGLNDFQKAYLEDEANVLIMIGTPGSGKTSFIRDLIKKHNLSAAITYDEDLMKMDKFFIDFINGKNDILIIEDADILLQDRASGNKIMNKLLNAGDGLIKTKKKMIFTANLAHLDEVDEALLRPGRCFEALVFRPLTSSEANAAARDAGIDEPHESRTLAELFNKGHSGNTTSHMGFGR